MRTVGGGTQNAAPLNRAFGIGPAALDVVLDGRHVPRQLCEGTTVTAVLTLAAEHGIDVRRR
ncbi:hypothetical protein [Streptomyces flaveolus]|uniref:hypothetical protein n=1 Tax=Streptomyces flaveolus TaxID=67297 RepID=UPI0033C009BA